MEEYGNSEHKKRKGKRIKMVNLVKIHILNHCRQCQCHHTLVVMIEE